MNVHVNADQLELMMKQVTKEEYNISDFRELVKKLQDEKLI